MNLASLLGGENYNTSAAPGNLAGMQPLKWGQGLGLHNAQPMSGMIRSGSPIRHGSPPQQILPPYAPDSDPNNPYTPPPQVRPTRPDVLPVGMPLPTGGSGLPVQAPGNTGPSLPQILANQGRGGVLAALLGRR